MITRRVAPCLLLSGKKLVKTVQFADPKYVGDPINAVKIFNDKEVDEILIFDIDASMQDKKPQFEYLKEVVSEAFIPISYGGGIRTIEDVDTLFRIGVEKVCLNAINSESLSLIKDSSEKYGSQSIVGAVDIKKNFFGKLQVFFKNKKYKTSKDPISYIKDLENAGVGEICINFVDRDGTFKGYDLDFIKQVTEFLKVPLVVIGGAGSIEHFSQAFSAGASAVCAGSMFVFHGPHRAVLINYPNNTLIDKVKFG